MCSPDFLRIDIFGEKSEVKNVPRSVDHGSRVALTDNLETYHELEPNFFPCRSKHTQIKEGIKLRCFLKNDHMTLSVTSYIRFKLWCVATVM